ncbi:MAG: transcriptional regulator [Planctomycetota bacterium]|jgi:DNA-binding MarR family transcriptional regulator
MSALNPVIHQPTRLRIMAALVALGPSDAIKFVELRDMLGVSDGNLGAHIQRLEAEGYISVDKRFVARKPCTLLKARVKGRHAFETYVAALRGIIAETEVKS